MNDRNALEVRLAVEKAHPEIRIVTPLSSLSGQWELCIGDGDTAFFSDFWTMVDSVAGQFGDVEACS